MNQRINAVKESINHWNRMIAWVRTQKKHKRVNEYEMKAAINEDWYSNSCEICRIYHGNEELCPLNIVQRGGCGKFSSAWKKVDNSETWGKWLTASRKMIRVLKKALRNEKNIKRIDALFKEYSDGEN